MLTKRIIPCLDIKEARVVKGVKFLGLRDAGSPVEVARAYEQQGADELVFLDITASFEGRKTLVGLVEEIAGNIFMPFTVGGGIADVQDIRDILNAGAEKVSINTAAVKYPDLISIASGRFGSQCIVVAIDAKLHIANRLSSIDKNATCDMRHATSPEWQVYIHGGRTPAGLDVVEWAKKARDLGAGEILLTSMDYDGTKDGYDLELTRRVSDAVDIPVIASGGAGDLEHFFRILTEGHADACLAASLFHYQEYTIRQVKDYLKQKGVAVRL